MKRAVQIFLILVIVTGGLVAVNRVGCACLTPTQTGLRALRGGLRAATIVQPECHAVHGRFAAQARSERYPRVWRRTTVTRADTAGTIECGGRVPGRLGF